jgi:hypothetical protein
LDIAKKSINVIFSKGGISNKDNPGGIKQQWPRVDIEHAKYPPGVKKAQDHNRPR